MDRNDLQEVIEEMTTEAKVGSFSLGALAVLVFIIVHLSGASWEEKGYNIEAVFAHVDGLKAGNMVRYAGVEVGKITGVEPVIDGAKAHLMINKNVKIPQGSIFVVSTDGFMGEKFISILPNSEAENFLKPNDVVEGKSQKSLDDLITRADLVMADMETLLSSLNTIFGDERVQQSFIESAINIKELTANLNKMSLVLARMAVDNEGDIRVMVNNLKLMSANMLNASARVDAMITDFDNNGQTTADLREAIANLNVTSKRVEHMAASLEGVVTDPKTAENIKVTLQNARNVSEKADKMMTRVSNIKTEFGAELLYHGGEGRYLSNADFKIFTNPNSFLLLGVSDIGEENKTNLQIGSGNDKFTGRVGLIESKAGIGIDTKLGEDVKFSVDAYDPNDFRVKLRAQYEFAPNTFLVSQTDNINKSEERETFVGLRKTF